MPFCLLLLSRKHLCDIFFLQKTLAQLAVGMMPTRVRVQSLSLVSPVSPLTVIGLLICVQTAPSRHCRLSNAQQSHNNCSSRWRKVLVAEVVSPPIISVTMYWYSQGPKVLLLSLSNSVQDFLSLLSPISFQPFAFDPSISKDFIFSEVNEIHISVWPPFCAVESWFPKAAAALLFWCCWFFKRNGMLGLSAVTDFFHLGRLEEYRYTRMPSHRWWEVSLNFCAAEGLFWLD